MSLQDSPPWNHYAFHGGHREPITLDPPYEVTEEGRQWIRGEDHPKADDWREVT